MSNKYAKMLEEAGEERELILAKIYNKLEFLLTDSIEEKQISKMEAARIASRLGLRFSESAIKGTKV